MKKNHYQLVLIIVLLILNFIGCTSKDEGVNIGVILPLTGSSADAANQIKDGIELARDEMLKSSSEFKINLVFGDSRNQAKDGLSEYNKMRKLQNIKYFIASNSGVVSPLVQTMKNDKDVVLMSTVNSASGIPQSGENIYRIFVSVENEAKTMANFIHSELKLENISVLYINDDFGLSGKEVFSKKLKDLGNAVLWESSYEKSGIEFSNTIFKIPPKTEVVYVIGYDKAFGTIIKQLRKLGYNSTIVTTIGLSVPSWRAISGKAAEGAYYTAASYSTTSPSIDNEKFIEKFKSKFNRIPSSFSAFGYDAASVLFKSIKISKESGANINQVISEIDYTGSMGKITFNKFGEADLPLSIYRFKNTKEVKVK